MLVTEAFFLARRVHCYSQTTMAKNSCISSADAWLLTDIDEKIQRVRRDTSRHISLMNLPEASHRTKIDRK